MNLQIFRYGRKCTPDVTKKSVIWDMSTSYPCSRITLTELKGSTSQSSILNIARQRGAPGIEKLVLGAMAAWELQFL